MELGCIEFGKGHRFIRNRAVIIHISGPQRYLVPMSEDQPKIKTLGEFIDRVSQIRKEWGIVNTGVRMIIAAADICRPI